jgi:hypothetical protein
MDFLDIKDTIRIKSNSIVLNLLVTSGKDSNYFVIISPSIMVSGYGNTEDEAKQSFEHNIHLFCKEILDLSKDNRDAYLLKLGFTKKQFRTKNYSKVYIDENGVLQGLDPETIKTSIVKTTELIA